MNATLVNVVLLLNFINCVQAVTNSTTSLFKPTYDPTSSSTGDESSAISRTTIAIILGICLAALICGCMFFFLCKAHYEQAHFANDRQLLKRKNSKKNGYVMDSRSEKEQTTVFAEEIL